jgi:hypothetical protein
MKIMKLEKAILPNPCLEEEEDAFLLSGISAQRRDKCFFGALP